MEKKFNVCTTVATTVFNLIPDINIIPPGLLTLSDSLIEKLSRLTLKDQHYIACRAANFLSIHIDEQVLTRLLCDVKRTDEEQELEDQYIHSYATNTMMRELFGMHTTEFCARCKVLGLAGQGQHRPQYCDEATELLIWKFWKKFEHLDERTRYLKVAEVTGQPLNIVWPAIKRHIV